MKMEVHDRDEDRLECFRGKRYRQSTIHMLLLFSYFMNKGRDHFFLKKPLVCFDQYTEAG